MTKIMSLQRTLIQKVTQSTDGRYPGFFKNMPPCIGNWWLRKDPHGSLKIILGLSLRLLPCGKILAQQICPETNVERLVLLHLALADIHLDRNQSLRSRCFQRPVREMTLSPVCVLGSSIARRDRTSAWSAMYLL